MSELIQDTGDSTEARSATEEEALLGATVLAVDDVEDSLDLIEDLLEDEVWRVQRAQSR